MGQSSRRLACAAMCLAFTFGGIVVSDTAEGRPSGTRLKKKTRVRTAKTTGAANKRSKAIRGFAQRWLGTKYRWGGATGRGIDCSAYAREMFRELFRVELPRTTRTQIGFGVDVPLKANALGDGFEPGDLFYYVDPRGTPNHVVVYIGDGRFTHSASGRGVVIEGYRALWGRRIVGRRVLFPASTGEGFAPIPSAGPFAATAVPCPPGIRIDPTEIRRFRRERLPKISSLPERELCAWRKLGKALDGKSAIGTANAIQLRAYIEWLESLDSFKDEL